MSPAILPSTLKNVTIEQALEAVKEAFGYSYHKTAFGYQVSSGGLQTRIFTVNYLNISREGSSETTISSGEISTKVSENSDSDGSTSTSSSSTNNLASRVTTTSSTNFWEGLEATLSTLIGVGEGRSVVINPQTGIIVVRAFPKELDRIAEFLDTAEKFAHPASGLRSKKFVEVETQQQNTNRH